MIMSECSEFSECQPTSDTVQQASKQQPPTHPPVHLLTAPVRVHGRLVHPSWPAHNAKQMPCK